MYAGKTIIQGKYGDISLKETSQWEIRCRKCENIKDVMLSTPEIWNGWEGRLVTLLIFPKESALYFIDFHYYFWMSLISSITFIISFFLLAVGLFSSSFSTFLWWELRWLTLFLFRIYAFSPGCCGSGDWVLAYVPKGCLIKSFKKMFSVCVEK